MKALRNTTREGGFTLIELVMVIVILGILAAQAIPKFVDLGADARESTLKGLQGSVNSAMHMAHAAALARSQTGATGTISVEGTNVGLVYGYPSNAGIKLMLNLDGFLYNADVTDSTAIYVDGAATKASCQLTYTEAASAGAVPSVSIPSTPDCS